MCRADSRFKGPLSQLVERLGVKLLIGKGSMGQEALCILSKLGAAYLITTVGTAAYYANQIEEIRAVH